MTPEETAKMKKLVAHTPTSLWGYWPFVTPLLFCALGLVFQFFAAWGIDRYFNVELLARSGGHLSLLWGSDMLNRLVLTSSLLIVLNLGFFTLLAAHNFKLQQALKKCIEERTDRMNGVTS
jgi:hypothetical protein